jgi:hypothetical protein
MADPHANFAYSTVATAPTPATSGTTLSVQTGDGAKFPTITGSQTFNCTVWPSAVQPTAANAEIVTVTSKGTGDNWTITRNNEAGGSAISIAVGYQIAATITAKTLTDIENVYCNSFAPIVLQIGSGLQTLNNSSGSSSTGSLFLFPVTLQAPVKFNQILVPQSLSYVLSAVTNSYRNSYYSSFGIYSLSANSLLNLISSNSFSIAETLSLSSNNAASVTWVYPTTTATSVTTNGSAVAYGYGSFPAGNLTGTAQIGSYISGTRIVGLAFSGEVSLSGGQHWIGILSNRSTAISSVVGLSHAGLIGQIINPVNMNGTVSGLKHLGNYVADWPNNVTHITGWFGHHLGGFVTATSINNFLGSLIPNNITISQLAGVAASQTLTIIPAVTFVST